jgi:myo-inositol-1(or 4)-monophosphatase
MTEASEKRIDDALERIEEALEAANGILAAFTPGEVESRRKKRGDPVTDADHAVDDALRRILPRDGEGWLSEETTDDRSRLTHERVWIVDPLDGTREFVDGIPEWCVSIGLVENGQPLAGGISNPATGETIVGASGRGVRLNGEPVRASEKTSLDGAIVLASRSEVKRGEWALFEGAPFEVRPMGSVAYKLALVAAGKCDATWTVVPKNEWDVAGGSALVIAAGGELYEPDGSPRRFNQENPLLSGFVAHPRGLRNAVEEQVRRALAHRRRAKPKD